MLPLISAGASLLGSIFSSSTSASNTQAQIAAQQQSQQQSEQFNASQAQLNREFQDKESSTAYQRASADMRSAGLNPMMMASGGMSASSPSGSTASVGTPSVPMPTKTSPLGNLGDVVSKALDSQIAQQTYSKLVEETSNLTATRAKILAETEAKKKEPANIEARTKLIGEEERGKRQQNLRDLPATAEAAGVMEMPGSLLENVGKAKYVSGAAGDVIAPVVSTATRALGLDLLRKGMTSRNSATSFRRGMDTEREYPSGGSLH